MEVSVSAPLSHRVFAHYHNAAHKHLFAIASPRTPSHRFFLACAIRAGSQIYQSRAQDQAPHDLQVYPSMFDFHPSESPLGTSRKMTHDNYHSVSLPYSYYLISL